MNTNQNTLFIIERVNYCISELKPTCTTFIFDIYPIYQDYNYDHKNLH